MAGRGRGTTLPAWMTQTHVPGAPGPLVASLPAASSPPADTGQLLVCTVIVPRSLQSCNPSACTGPSYSSDIVEAAQAQVLQEQELAVQQAIASNRCAVRFLAATCYMF